MIMRYLWKLWNRFVLAREMGKRNWEIVNQEFGVHKVADWHADVIIPLGLGGGLAMGSALGGGQTGLVFWFGVFLTFLAYVYMLAHPIGRRLWKLSNTRKTNA